MKTIYQKSKDTLKSLKQKIMEARILHNISDDKLKYLESEYEEIRKILYKIIHLNG